jgi:DNA replication initiation complex subunit (GINS family)
MKLRSTAKDALDRYEMLFLNGSRECSFRKNVPEFVVSDKKYGPFKKGDRIALPNWVIEKLMNEDLAEIVAAQAHESLRQLQNIYREEEKHPFKLQPFHPFIYAAMNRKMHRLQSDKTDIDPRKYDEVEKLKKMTPLIVETRLSKVLRVAKAGSFKERSSQMANEEKWLCKELSELLEGWRQNITE